MPSAILNLKRRDAWGLEYNVVNERRDWATSPRVNGKLRLVSNEHQRYLLQTQVYRPRNRFGASLMQTFPNWSDFGDGVSPTKPWPNLESESYARFRGKLYKGSAALGVNLGGYKQSREMIVKRSQQLVQRADEVLANGFKGHAKSAAGVHLEVIFGWVPLLTDIHASCETVIQQADAYHCEAISARSVGSNRTNHNFVVGDARVRSTRIASARVTRSALVYIVNRNRWLAERAGLLNPAAVAWDLVPWSFVINMFVNTGQLVNSITDFAGLEFRNGSLTRRYKFLCIDNYEAAVNNGSTWRAGDHWGLKQTVVERKTQTLNPTDRPPLTFKLPDANWNLAAMAASLVTQKFGAIKKLMKII